MTIVRVQGNARGTSASQNTIGVTLASAPTEGNVLVATIGTMTSGGVTVDHIYQAGVNWTHQKTGDLYQNYINSEIWLGVVGSGASPAITIYLTSTPQAYYQIADVCEYSGIKTSDYLDKTGTAAGASTATNTGTTGETSQNNELWIGCVYCYSGVSANQHYDPTNGFTLLDGASILLNGWESLAYLERIVSTAGAAKSGTAIATSSWFNGCIAAFKASVGTDVEVTGNLTVDANSTLNNNIVIPCAAPSLTKQQMTAQTYGYISNVWQPQYSATPQNPNPNPSRSDGVQSFLPGSSYLTFKNNQSSIWPNLFMVSDAQEGGGLLCLDQGLIVKKDVYAGGSLFCGQGALLLGHGLTACDDPPKICLSHGDDYRTLLNKYGLYDGESATFPTGTLWHCFVHTGYTPNRLYQYTASGWVSLGSIENWNGGWDTLYITTELDFKEYGEEYTSDQLGNLKLNTIYAMGCVNGGGDNENNDAFKIGDNCCLVDVNADGLIGVQGVSNRNIGGFKFGKGDGAYYHKLYVEGSYLKYYCNGGANPCGFMPADGMQNLGGSSTTSAPYAWRHIYGRWIHAYDQFGSNNSTIGAYDSLDDLGVIKNIKSKRVKREGDTVERDVIDFSNLRFLQLDEESISINNAIGFLFGVCKFLALKVDELEAKIAKKGQ